MHAHAHIMANQQGNGQNGYRNQHRDEDDRRGARDAEYRGMGQSGYGAGRDADDASMGTRTRNPGWGSSREGGGERDYGRGRWEEGRMGYSQGYSYRDGDRPSFERGLHDYDRGYGQGPHGGGYEENRGTREQHERGPQGYGGSSMGGARGLEQRRGSHRGKGPKGFEMTDDRVRERVCEALHEDHDVDASDIDVSVSHGEVTLMGTVDDRQSKRMAEDCVLQCAGVRDVHNQLRVRR